jgi:protein pelota
MIILKKDFKQGIVSLKISLQEDLWYLSHIVAPEDKVTMKSERKIKISQGSDEASSVKRQMVILTLDVEDVNYDSSLQQLRLKGKIIECPDDVPKGSYHTFGVELNSSLTIQKKSWPNYLRDKLDESLKSNSKNILIVVFDREEAIISLVKQTNIEYLVNLTADVQKKDLQSNIGETIYSQIVKKVTEYLPQYNISNIIFASPSFWKQYLETILPQEIKSKSTFTTCSEVHKKVVSELLSRTELKSILESQRTASELEFVNLMLEKLEKNLISYGIQDISHSSQMGAISQLAVTEKFINKMREQNTYDLLDSILSKVDSSNGKIIFITSDEASKQIDGFGGIVGILRWNINQ